MKQKHIKLTSAQFVLEHTDGIEVGRTNNEKNPIFLKVSGLLLINMSTDQAFNIKQDLEKVLWKAEER